MKVWLLTDDRLGAAMAGSALRAWELGRTLVAAGHEVRIVGGPGSAAPDRRGPTLAPALPWRGVDVVVAPAWCLSPRMLLGRHRLVVDGATPLLAELAAMPDSATIRRRRRTAAARLPLVAARADAVLVAGPSQESWWRAHLGTRPVPVLQVPFGLPEDDLPTGRAELAGVPSGWSVVLWWGGVWPWLDLDTLLAARARLGARPVSLVVPTAPRPGAAGPGWSTDRLLAAAADHGLAPPQVVPLEHWVPYRERGPVLGRAAVVAVLHHPGEEAELAFRTRALDALWAGVPMLLSEGGAVAEAARDAGWGAVVPVHDPRAAAAALELLLGERARARISQAMARDRDQWRWREVARPLTLALPRLPSVRHGSLLAGGLRAAATMAGLALRSAR